MPVWKARSAEFKKLWKYSVGFYGVWIAHVGRRMGLFEAIAAKNAMTPDDLAAETNFHAGAVKAWCSAALALGFLKSKGKKKLCLSATMKEILLDKKSINYLGGQFSYIALRSLEYRGFEDLIKRGKTREMASTFEAIVEATDWDHNIFLTAIKRGKSRQIDAMLCRGCKVLDVGCGTGTLIEKLVQNYPSSSFVGVEPSATAVHKAIKMAAGRQIKILHETGEAMRFENEFDLVYLGESLYAASDKPAVISNCHAALKRGGAIAIVEGLMPSATRKHGYDDEGRLIMGMQVDFSLQGHRFMTRKEIAALLKATGFLKLTFQHFGGSLYLATAWKY